MKNDYTESFTFKNDDNKSFLGLMSNKNDNTDDFLCIKTEIFPTRANNGNKTQNVNHVKFIQKDV